MNKLLSISNIAITFIGIYLGYLYYSTKNYTINFTKLIEKNDKLGRKINKFIQYVESKWK